MNQGERGDIQQRFNKPARYNPRYDDMDGQRSDHNDSVGGYMRQRKNRDDDSPDDDRDRRGPRHERRPYGGGDRGGYQSRPYRGGFNGGGNRRGGPPGSNPGARCFNCGSSDHFVKNCPEPNPHRDGGGGGRGGFRGQGHNNYDRQPRDMYSPSR